MALEQGMTQADYVRSRIEQQIARGQLLPGQRIEEVALAAQFGTSRTPVREAVAQLVSSGLLTKSARQGTFVARFDVQKTLELVEYSAELAATSAFLAARRMNAQDIAYLRAINTELEARIAAGDVSAYAVEASRFHTRIIQKSQNAFLVKALDTAVVQLAAYFRFELTYPGGMRRDLDEHLILVDALAARDGERARTLMRQHAQLDADVIRDYVAYLDSDETDG
ncbi:MAG: GntR family transcriptional regulator [Pseudomonas sp.]